MRKTSGVLYGFLLAVVLFVGMGLAVSNPFDVTTAIMSKLVDSDGDQADIENGMLQTTEYKVEVAKGHIAGHSAINKYGYNPTCDAGDDVWGGDGVYAFYPTSAVPVWAVSAEAGDASGSTGAQEVTFFGLTDGWIATNEVVVMNGTTPVALSNNYIRMYRGFVHKCGSSTANLGDITVTNASGTVAIHIEALRGQTQHTIYTVPEGKRALFVKGYVAMGNDDKNGIGARFEWQARLNDGYQSAWLTKGDMDLVNIGSGTWQYEYGVPSGILPERTDIRIRVVAADAQIRATGGYDLLLIDDGY